MRRLTTALALIGSLVAWPMAVAADAAEEVVEVAPESSPVDELLERVRQGWRQETAENREREARFRRERDKQQQLLEDARIAVASEDARSEALEASFQENELTLAQLEETLRERSGALGELFGVVRQVAGDTAGNLEASLTSARLAGRTDFLSELGQSKSLPSIRSLEQLWFLLHQEMSELGKVARFRATVVGADGEETEREVIRIGAFNAVSGGNYLVWKPEVGKLAELVRQPAGIYKSTVPGFEKATSGTARLAIDPTRGSVLQALVKTPDVRERIEQGGAVGYTIITLGVLAGLVAVVRWLYVFVARRKVARQRKTDEVSADNALGRVLGVYNENPAVDAETLELKLDEAILRESSRLESFLWAIRVVSVVAPLLGLLGTVTGMIRTFQAITLFGTGDPTMMASGISEALVTTMLGLTVAIPLVLLHAAVASSSRSVVEILKEQAAGLLVLRAERSDAAG